MTQKKGDNQKEHCWEIVLLPKEEWEGEKIPMRYTTEEYYDVEIGKREEGYRVEIHRQKFDTPVSHYPEEYDFPDKLYQPHWEKACAWGIITGEGEGRHMLACIETCPEEWSNRLMVTELWVEESLRRQGIGHRLMAIAKDQAIRERRRAIILETQSCNVGAIAFYEQEGFELIGFDSCCYSNRDRERKEVRINMGCFCEKVKIQFHEMQAAISVMREVAAWGREAGYRVWPDAWLTPEELQNQDVRPENFCIGTLAGEVACAFCLQWTDSVYWPDAPAYEAAYLHKFCVRRRFAGMGMTRLVVEAIREECRSRGIRYIRLDTALDEERVGKIYLDAGFHIVKVIACPNGRSMALYEKEV